MILILVTSTKSKPIFIVNFLLTTNLPSSLTHAFGPQSTFSSLVPCTTKSPENKTFYKSEINSVNNRP